MRRHVFLMATFGVLAAAWFLVERPAFAQARQPVPAGGPGPFTGRVEDAQGQRRAALPMKITRYIPVRRHRVAIATVWLSWSLIQVSAQTTNLVLRGAWPESSGGSAVAVAVAGHYAYVANGGHGLAIIDVSDPAHPVRVGSYQTEGYADGVYVLEHYVYLSASFAGMYVLDVTDPANPVQVGSADRTGFFHTAQAVGNLLFLGAGNLKVLNVSNPASPRLVADVQDMGSVFSLRSQAYCQRH